MHLCVTPIRYIFEDLFLVDFYERNNTTKLVTGKEVINWSKTILGTDDNVTKLYSDGGKRRSISFDYYDKLDKRFNQEFHIKSILELGKGKIAILSELYFLPVDHIYLPGGYTFCFHSCTVEEAKDILVKAILLLEKYYRSQIDIRRIDYCEYTLFDDILSLDACFWGGTESISFDLKIYKDKGQMLRSTGPTIYQQGYDSDGFFTTMLGGVSVALSVCPLDVTFESHHFELMEMDNIDLLVFGVKELPKGSYLQLGEDKLYNEGHRYDLDTSGRCSIEDISEDSVSYPQFNTYDEFKDITLPFVIYKPIPRRSIASWSKQYVPIKVGISDDVFVTLHNIKRSYGLSNDIFQLLCWWLLRQEVDTIYTKMIEQ